ncbi:MAG: calcium-binding protein [Gammaproteobacteria bacterium]
MNNTLKRITLLASMALAPPLCPADAPASSGPETLGPVAPGVFTGDVRQVPQPKAPAPGERVREVPRRVYPRPAPAGPPQPSPPDPLLEPQSRGIEGPLPRVFSPPQLNFAGVGFTGVAPPDTVGDVGPNHYIQMVNSAVSSQVRIFDKAGVQLAGFVLDSLWTAGGACASGAGDPIVLYDPLADRWLLSEFASAGNHLCVYISQTASPTGSYFLYDFTVPQFPDYPKYGVWPDAYYVSTNEASGPAAYALGRTAMLAGNPATGQRFVGPNLAGFPFQAFTPADLDGPTAPPAGSPGYFVRHVDDEVHFPGTNNPNQDFLEVYAFHVDFVTPANSTFALNATIPVAEFSSDLCGLASFNCFPQPGTANTLDPLREVIMFRAAYRNFNTHEVMVLNHVTDVSGADHGGIRWYELRKSGAGGWAPFQQGTHAPDASDRWMGSIAMDRQGNIALGYSVSDATAVFPSIRYAGRQISDPAGTLPSGEATILNGTASQTTNTRWGDYSAMSVDPADDCTFWYTNEYVAAGGNWATQIATFNFPSCLAGAPPPSGTCRGVTATLTGTSGNDTLTGTPSNDVIVGLGGSDTIKGLGGNDRICAGSGNDTATGGSGSDRIYGDSGNDRLSGNSGNDRLEGGSGKDRMTGGPGRDTCIGGSGRDTASGCERVRGVP